MKHENLSRERIKVFIFSLQNKNEKHAKKVKQKRYK